MPSIGRLADGIDYALQPRFDTFFAENDGKIERHGTRAQDPVVHLRFTERIPIKEPLREGGLRPR